MYEWSSLNASRRRPSSNPARNITPLNKPPPPLAQLSLGFIPVPALDNMGGKKKEDSKKADSAKGKGKGADDKSKDKDKGGSTKGAQSINVRHILVGFSVSSCFYSPGNKV